MILTRDGWKELVVLTALCAAATVAAVIWFWPLAAVPLLVLAWGLWFFRDPSRAIPDDPHVLVAPADGKVVAVERVQQNEWTGAPALRIDIFLSIFDAHMNRSPCAAVVQQAIRKAGGYLNAMRAEAASRNCSNTLVLHPKGDLPAPVVVRQIVGVIARRIVCHARPGDDLKAGQRFGMIKFGSRTELYVPDRDGWQVLVRPGQKVRAGSSPLVRWNDSTVRP
jgi:phosphatidylserine decarboxylase